MQLDYVLPERFGLEYIGAGQPAAPAGDDPPRPVRQHGAVLGILIEHFAGAFPLWLAPEQVRVLPISRQGRRLRPDAC